MQVIRNYWRVEKSSEDGIYDIIASTKDIDRMGEIVEPRGLVNLEAYLRKNPVILLNHLWTVPPIGKAVDGAISDDDVRLRITFAPTPLGQEIKSLYDGGFMSAFSIGFKPLEIGTKVIDNVDHRVYSKWELMETSAVDVPANEGATIVRSALDAGLALPALVAALRLDATSAPHGGTRDEQRSWALRIADKWSARGDKR
jgi:HK97 family phage prohead protease